MGRHRRDEIETQTSPDDDQLAAAWRLHFPLDLMNPTPRENPTKEWPETDTSTYPIRFLDTLKITLESWAFNMTKGEAVTRYADVTDSGLPASDTAPTQVLVTMPTKTGGPVTLLAALAEHPVHKDAYHVQLLVCKGERALEDGAVAATLHHTVVCALGVLPTRPALGFIVKDIWNNAGAYLRGRRAFMHTISLDDAHPALPVATRYKIGYEATPPAGLYQP